MCVFVCFSVCLFFIPGADKWKNGGDVIVDYNTADPLTRWDSYQNICDGEGTVVMPQWSLRDSRD